MKILITGSTGLIGKAMGSLLREDRHTVVGLRRTGGLGEPFWDPEKQIIEARSLEGFDGVIHLAGESIASLRWTAGKKRRIRDSRVNGTRLLSRTLAGLAKAPRWLLCASAVGYYGDRGADELREDSAPGADFLAETCKAWEAASEPAARRGIRVAHMRLGIVLSRHGGALARMLLPFRLGMGGRIGSGRQYMPWISLEDVLGAARHIFSRELSGPFNLTAPQAVTNQEFTAALGKSLHRPAVMPLPAFAARLIMGEMADRLLLSSQRVEPAALLKSGYQFKHPDLAGALESALHGGRRGV